MTTLRWASGMLALLCVVLAFVAGVANGLLLLATIFAGVLAWSCGMFTAGFWVTSDPVFGRVDDQLDFTSSVMADINAL